MKNNLKPFIKIMEKAQTLIITHQNDMYYVSDTYSVLEVSEVLFKGALMPLSAQMRETPEGTTIRRNNPKELPTRAPLVSFEKIMEPLNPSYPTSLSGFFTIANDGVEMEIIPTPGYPAIIQRKYTDAIRAAIPEAVYAECASYLKPFFFWNEEMTMRFCVLPCRILDDTYNKLVAFAKALNID